MFFIALTLISLGTGAGLISLILLTPTTIETFSSYESKNAVGEDVFNKIKFFPSWKKDIWVMNQSHEGIDFPEGKWDRVAIVVDKSQKPYVSKFYQLKPGKLEFNQNIEVAPLRASCFSCHISGPRAIRPDPEFKMSLKQKMLISLLNFRIKSYGNSKVKPGHKPLNEVGFDYNFKYSKQKISLESCNTCHNEDGIRGPLEIQNLHTIRFLVSKGKMPPWPFSISKFDKGLILGTR